MSPKNPRAVGAAKIAASAFFPGVAVALQMADLVGTIMGTPEDTAETLKRAKDTAALQHEMDVQQGLLTIAEGRARIARELAIARRIDTAEEVEIEEYYDSVREGQGGLNVDPKKGVSLGGSGSGKNVSKRVYRFKGWRDGGLEALMAQMGQMSSEELEALKETENGRFETE